VNELDNKNRIMAKKRKLNSTNPKYKKTTTTTGPVDIFTHELICTTCENGLQLRAASIMVDQFYWLHCNAVSTEALNKKVALKLRSFRIKSLEE
jgi:hypothetical protein